MKLRKIIKTFVETIDAKIEEDLIKAWQWLIKTSAEENQFVDLVAIGRAKDKTIYAKGFCATGIGPRSKRPVAVLRSMVQSKLVAEKGPMPAEKIHKLVMLPLPSLLLRSTPFELYDFISDWEGRTDFQPGIPYCFYTLLR